MKTSNNEERMENQVRYMFGKWVETVQEGTEGAIPRPNKNGVLVHEVHYDNIEGQIVWIETSKGKYDEDLVITLMSDGEKGAARIMFDCRQATDIMKCIENADLSRDVKLEVWDYDPPFIAIMQDKERVLKKYENDDLPAWKNVTIGEGTPDEKVISDRSGMLQFFRDVVLKIQKDIGQYGQTAKRNHKPGVQDHEVDDLPFGEPIKPHQDDPPNKTDAKTEFDEAKAEPSLTDSDKQAMIDKMKANIGE